MEKVFVDLKKQKGRTVLGRFNWNTGNIERNSGLRGEDETILAIVNAHERQHAEDYSDSGVNCVYNPDFEAKAHLAALRNVSSGGGSINDLQAETETGRDVIEDLKAIDEEYRRRCEDSGSPVTYEPDMNNLCFMSNALWDLEKRSESEMKSKLIKKCLLASILAIAIICVLFSLNMKPENQKLFPLSSPSPISTLTYTPQPNRCLSVTGSLSQTISAWKTRYPGKDPYYYGQVDKVGEKGLPCY